MADQPAPDAVRYPEETAAKGAAVMSDLQELVAGCIDTYRTPKTIASEILILLLRALAEDAPSQEIYVRHGKDGQWQWMSIAGWIKSYLPIGSEDDQ